MWSAGTRRCTEILDKKRCRSLAVDKWQDMREISTGLYTGVVLNTRLPVQVAFVTAVLASRQ